MLMTLTTINCNHDTTLDYDYDTTFNFNHDITLDYDYMYDITLNCNHGATLYCGCDTTLHCDRYADYTLPETHFECT